jgi:ubiquinone/menaquinone biosynthesis C-methylase UbiE
MMANLKEIYRNAAERYQALVGREDYQGNLLPAILSIDPLAGKDVLELGAGTGRISCLIAPIVNRLVATDISHHMLAYGKRRLEALFLANWHLGLASHRALPLASRTADVILAGWSFCYAALDAGEQWQPALEEALAEVRRVLRPGGVLILIESLGTGFELPNRPDVLVDYLAYLDTHGFESTWVRTDYCFESKAEAKDLTTFFFGEARMPMWETTGGVIVPECTGLWWKTLG